jgi:hypothetical protein
MPREYRTRDEKLTDAALLLALLGQVARDADIPYVGDRLKVMKLAFLAAHRMFAAREKGFNFTFYRWKHGPFSKHVCQTWDMLKASDLLREEEEFSLSVRGRKMGAAFWRDVLSASGNGVFARTIRDTAKQFGSWNHDDVIGHVYGMRVAPVGQSRQVIVRNLPEGTHLTEALTAAEAKQAIHVEQAWLETLAIALNPRNLRSLNDAEQDLALGRVAQQ